jgi:hypothetical protein
MNIEEVQQKKRSLEENILNQLEDFQKETGLFIDSIYLKTQIEKYCFDSVIPTGKGYIQEFYISVKI